MRQRDKTILKDLERFRVLSRDDIIELHFNQLKQPVTNANMVLKRLRRDGYIDVNMNHQPYLYFPSPAPIKKDSAKIPHFLKIVEFYKDVRKYEEPASFLIEPKFGPKGTVEPDIFMRWKKGVFFVEIQRTVYSEKLMNEKVQRYEAYYFSDQWKEEPWQPAHTKIFPPVILITDTRYRIESEYIKFFQVPNISELVHLFEPKPTKLVLKDGKLQSP